MSRAGTVLAAALALFLVASEVRAQAPIEIRAEPDLSGIHLARSGWTTGSVRLINRADQPVTGTLVASGFDQSFPPSLLGRRDFSPVTVPARGSLVLPVIYSRSWHRTSFVFRDDADRLLSELDGDTVIVTGGDIREPHEQISIISVDQAWAAQMNEVIGYQGAVITNLERAPINASSGLIVDVTSPPPAPRNRPDWMQEAVASGRTVLFVLRGPLESLPPALAKILFDSGAPMDTLVAQSSSREFGLFRGAGAAWLLTAPDDLRGGNLNTQALVPLLSRTPFQEQINRAGGDAGYFTVDRALFHRIRSQPPLGFFVILLGAYALVVVPGVYIVLGRKGRRELAWLILPGAGLIVSIAILLVGAYQHGWRDRIAVYEVIRDFEPDGLAGSESPQVRREIVIGCFSGSFSEKRFSIASANAASPIPGSGMYNGGFMEKGREAGPISIRPSGESGLALELPVLFWAGRSFRFASIETPSSSQAPGETAAFANAARQSVMNGSWSGEPIDPRTQNQLLQDFESEATLVRSLAQCPDIGAFEVLIVDGAPPGLVLPQGSKLVVAKRILVRRKP